MITEFNLPKHGYLIIEYKHRGYIVKHIYSKVSHHIIDYYYIILYDFIEKWINRGIPTNKIIKKLNPVQNYFILQRWSSLDYKNKYEFQYIRDYFWGETRLFMVITNNHINNFGIPRLRHDESEFRVNLNIKENELFSYIHNLVYYMN